MVAGPQDLMCYLGFFGKEKNNRVHDREKTTGSGKK